MLSGYLNTPFPFNKDAPVLKIICTHILVLLGFIVCTTSQAEIIHKEPSLYRTILVEDNNDMRCLRFNVKAKNINQTCFYKSQPKKLVFNYTKLLFSALLLNNQPTDILIVGLGGGTMSNALHQLLPDSNITNIEIDPAMIKVARDHFNFIENDKVKTFSRDGRLFIKRAKLKKRKYDWIILDAFNGDYIPEHLLTKEFLVEAKALLKKDGLLTSNTFISSQLYAHESATYHAVFGEFFNIKNLEKQNRVILVSNQTLSALPNNPLFLAKVKQLKILLAPYDIDLEDIIENMKLTLNNHDWPNDTKILTDQYSPANLLMTQ